MNGIKKTALYQGLFRSQNKKTSVNRREHCAQKCERSLIMQSIIIMGPGWLRERIINQKMYPLFHLPDFM